MMIEEDRKKVFWLLKKYSSYTAWKALADAYSDFARAWEYAMSHAKDEDIDEFNTEATKDILDGQIAFEKGLAKLKQGDRNVFRNSSIGYFYQAIEVYVFVSRIMDPEEYMFDWMVNKDEVIAAFNRLKLRSYISGYAFERPSPDVPAAMGSERAFDDHPSLFNFPPTLPSVPPEGELTVITGSEVPTSGIWEPEWGSSSGLLGRLVGSPATLGKGSMNYLVAGTVAPMYRDGPLMRRPGDETLAVTWRLIWEDRRYEDGTIPEEENEYLAAPGGAIIPAGRLRALPAELVPKTGLWWSPAIDNGKPRPFSQGDRFPDTATTDYGAVVWYFDPDKQQGA